MLKNSTKFIVWGLPITLYLSACNQAGVSSSGVEKLVDPIPLAQNDPARQLAARKLATKLSEQKKSLLRSQQAKKAAELQPKKPILSTALLSGSTIGTPKELESQQLKTGAVNRSVKVPTLPKIEVLEIEKGPLSGFHTKLAGLRAGSRTKPVVILHIGDSHVASDSFSRGVRTALQSKYGNAGRGMVIPAAAFKYGVADQVKLTARGRWRSSTALKQKRGRFGISGVSVSSRSSRSAMKLKSNNGLFDWAKVTVATGPSQGAVTMKVGDKKQRFDAYSKKRGSKEFRIDAQGDLLEVIPGGGAQTTVLNWTTGRNQPGIQYVNFGLIGATVDITKRFDKKLVANDVSRLDPDLIIYGYGTNEGFNDRLQLSAYRKRAASYVEFLKTHAPNAEVVYLGAASGLRRRGNRKCGGWSVPPRLGPLRRTVRNLAAAQNAAYWDWSAAMGGACSVNRWAGQGLAAKDRVHLTSKGYKRSANAFAKWLMVPKSSNVTVASK